tara:strand:+ start:359 stop:502 length:144 start_codon:yes stop_codon:yes gene_type:complete
VYIIIVIIIIITIGIKILSFFLSFVSSFCPFLFFVDDKKKSKKFCQS